MEKKRKKEKSRSGDMQRGDINIQNHPSPTEPSASHRAHGTSDNLGNPPAQAARKKEKKKKKETQRSKNLTIEQKRKRRRWGEGISDHQQGAKRKKGSVLG